MKSKLKVLLLTLFLISCKNEVQKNVIDENFCSDELEIIIDENRIVINKEGNFGTLETNQKTQPKLFKLLERTNSKR